MRMVRTKDTRLRVRASGEDMRTVTLLPVESDGCKTNTKGRVRECQRRGIVFNYSQDHLGVRSM